MYINIHSLSDVRSRIGPLAVFRIPFRIIVFEFQNYIANKEVSHEKTLHISM